MFNRDMEVVRDIVANATVYRDQASFEVKQWPAAVTTYQRTVGYQGIVSNFKNSSHASYRTPLSIEAARMPCGDAHMPGSNVSLLPALHEARAYHHFGHR